MLRSVASLCALAFLGCQQEPSRLALATSGVAAPSVVTPRAATPPAPAGELSGTVVETIDASEYTYVRLDHAGKELWVAGPKARLAVGTKLGAMTGTEMRAFHSDTLNRTFERIYFVNEFPGGAVAAASAPPTAAAPPSAAPSASADAGEELSGVVVETMNAGGYTYARLERDGKSLWVAGPETKLAVGSRLGKLTGTEMLAFHSSTLNRTFDKIYFVNGYNVVSGAIANPHGGAAPATSVVEKIAPAAGGKTVADVFAGKDGLAGKPVEVRGKIVKVANGILGKNWVHVQDGTGAPGSNDLIVTTQATVNVGDVVVIRGTVATKQDIGGGYKYDVIVENATISAQ